MDNQITPQQPESDSKAVASLVLGILSVISLGIIIGPKIAARIVGSIVVMPVSLVSLLMPAIINIIFGLPGLFLGILGLKSTKRNFAIGGIVLSTIGLVPALIVIGLIRWIVMTTIR